MCLKHAESLHGIATKKKHYFINETIIQTATIYYCIGHYGHSVDSPEDSVSRFTDYTDGTRDHGHLAMCGHARCREQLRLGYGSRSQRMKMRWPGSGDCCQLGCEIRAKRRRRFCELLRDLAQNLS
jgi:hypothetical protein